MRDQSNTQYSLCLSLDLSYTFFLFSLFCPSSLFCCVCVFIFINISSVCPFMDISHCLSQCSLCCTVRCQMLPMLRRARLSFITDRVKPLRHFPLSSGHVRSSQPPLWLQSLCLAALHASLQLTHSLQLAALFQLVCGFDINTFFCSQAVISADQLNISECRLHKKNRQ